MQKKLHAELVENMPSWDSPVDPAKLPYLRACFMEVTRFGPPTFSNSRITDVETQLGEYMIPTNVSTSTIFNSPSKNVLFSLKDTFL